MLDHAAASDHSLLQDAAFSAALGSLGKPTMHLPNGLMILSRKIMGVPMLMLPRATPPADLAAQLRALNLHRRPVILSPDTPCAMPRCLRLHKGQTQAVLDLSLPEDHRRSTLHGKWRNALCRAEKAGLKITRTHLPPDPHHPLLVEEDEQARRRGYANWPAVLTAAFAGVAPSQAVVFTARKGRREIAQCLFLRHGAQASYHIGHSSDEGRLHAAHNLLIWRAANWLAKQGCHSLDLGLIHERTPGLTRFKTRAGASLRKTGGTWLYWKPLARAPRP